MEQKVFEVKFPDKKKISLSTKRAHIKRQLAKETKGWEFLGGGAEAIAKH